MARNRMQAGDVIDFPGRDQKVSDLYDAIDQMTQEKERILDKYSKWNIRTSSALADFAQQTENAADDADRVGELEDEIDRSRETLNNLR